MPNCLIVRPALSADANGGDTVVYRKVERHLSRYASVETLELEPMSRGAQVLNMLRGLPPEAARYDSAVNRRRLGERLTRGGYDVVLYGHEAAFPLSTAAPCDAAKVFYSHNVHSLIAATDTSLLGRLMRTAALRFDRRWYAQADTRIVCISRADRQGLRRIGVLRSDIEIAPPGAPPAVELAEGAGVLAELVLTGSYSWWRKRRDLRQFAEEPALPFPILAHDPVAINLLGPQARAVEPAAVKWDAGVRFALITDRFQGGFKLKSLEYIALNSVVISFCDLGAEFEGIPYADEFVRFVRSKAEAGAVVEAMLASPPDSLISRFRAFKAACLERYDWERCLEPLERGLRIANTVEAPFDSLDFRPEEKNVVEGLA